MSIILVSNKLLVHPDFAAGFTGELTAYPATNLQVHHPTDFARTGTPATAPGHNLVSGTMGNKGDAYDVVACLYTNLTAHPQLFTHSFLSTDTDWTRTNLTAGADTTVTMMAKYGMPSTWYLNEGTNTGVHSIEQTYTTPNTNSDFDFVLWAYVFEESSQINECFLYMEDNGGDWVKAEFDLVGSGTAGTPTTGGSSWSATDSTITKITPDIGTEDCYLIELTGTVASSVSSLTGELRMGNGSGSDSYTGTSRTLRFHGLNLNMGSTVLDWVDNGDDTGAVYSFPDTQSWENVFKTDETERKRYQGWIHGPLISLSSPTIGSAGNCYVYINDENNADGYLQISNLLIGRNVAATPEAGPRKGYGQRTTDQYALGGQLYRPENEGFRHAAVSYEFMSEAERSELDAIDRAILASRGIMVVIDPTNTAYLHENWMYGVQNLQPFEHRTYSPTLGGNAWRRTYNMVEVIP